MKLSLKLPDDQELKNPILRGKLPISIFNQPFTSSFTSAINSSSDISFSLSTNFLSGPCLKLTYSPTPSSLATASAGGGGGGSTTPFSLSLKSGLGLFGSQRNSPLIFYAQFSLSLTKPVTPTFSLLFKPHLGNFCLKKRVSNANPDQFSGFQPSDGVKLDSGSHSNAKFVSGFSANESMGWQELKLEPCRGEGSQEKYGAHSNGGIGFEPQRQLAETKGIKDGIFLGVAVMARTVVPVTKRVALNLRWGMKFPANLATKIPYLTVNKISVERVEEEKEGKKKTIEGDMDDLDLLKGMLFWIKNDMETLEKENREMKQFLEEIRVGNVGNRASIPSSYGNLEPWRNNRSGGEERKSKNNINGGQENDWRKKRSTEAENESKNSRCGEKNGSKGHNSSNRVNEVESELERAIKAASQVKP